MDYTIKKYEKIIMRHGVSKKLANEIASIAWSASKGGNSIEMYIEYAVTLTFGSNFKLKLAE